MFADMFILVLHRALRASVRIIITAAFAARPIIAPLQQATVQTVAGGYGVQVAGVYCTRGPTFARDRDLYVRPALRVQLKQAESNKHYSK